MKIEKVTIDKINPVEYNPRVDLQPGDKDYEKLKKSIDTFGYVEPLVWNSRTGNLVGGHQRFKILVAQGDKEVEVSVVDLDPLKEKALNLALNKIGGDWDKDKLGHLLDDLTKLDGFDFELTGFDTGEISEAIDWITEIPEDPLANIDPNALAKTAKGDLIELGPHRVLCGDSTKKEDLDRLLAGAKAGLLFTDPPYNVNYGVNLSAGENNQTGWNKIANDNMPQDKYEEWLKQILTNVVAVLDEGAALYVWNGSRQFGPMYDMLLDLGVHISSVITWAKESFVFGRFDYKQQTEFCLYGWKDNNGSHKWYGPDNETTLWEIERDSTINYIHPTQKPIAIACRGITNSSKRGDIVLDLFLGSGTTLIAAQALSRRCYGIEMEPHYCDSIVKRYVQRVGRDKVSADLLKKYDL